MARARFYLTLTAALTAAAAAVVVILVTRDNRGDAVSAAPTRAYRGSIVPGHIRLPRFTLLDYSGRPVSTRSLRGRVVLVTFLDTACKDSCPIIAGVIGRAIPQLTPAERGLVSALAVTVDPSTDTPQSVRRFLGARGALGKLNFLLGSRSNLEPVWRAFHVLSAVASGDVELHSAPVRIYDRRGRWVSTLHAGADLTAANLVHDVREALRPGTRNS
jgi:protein SCO1